MILKVNYNMLLERLFNIVVILLLINARGVFYLFGNDNVNLVKFLLLSLVALFFFFRKKMDNVLIGFFIFLTVVFLNTYIKNDSPYLVFQRYVPLIATYIFIYINKNKIYSFFQDLYFSLEIMLIINAVTLLVFPDGMFYNGTTPNWFIGQKQDLAMIILPILVIGGLLYCAKKISLFRYILVIVISCYQMFFSLSLGLLIAFISFVISFFCLKKNIVTTNELLMLNLGLLVFIVLSMETFDRFEFFSNLLSTIDAGEFTKLDTLNVRFIIWKDALSIFSNNPLFGAGMISELRGYLFVHSFRYFENFHSIFFDILATTGIWGISFLSLLIFHTFSVNNKTTDIECLIIMSGVFAGNMLFLTEALYSPWIFALYFIAINSKWVRQKENRKI